LSELVSIALVFSRAAYKRLSHYEVDRVVANGHEFQGVKQFRQLLGTERRVVECRFAHLKDGAKPVLDDASLTWYEVGRRGRSEEYRAYFSTALVWNFASAGDCLFLIELEDDRHVAVVVQADSDSENMMQTLLGIGPNWEKFRNYLELPGEVDTELVTEFFHLVGLSDWSL